jgi:DNA invertase Pin-like site-specific DNA recombinase
MSLTFDIYARISQEGERTSDEVAEQLAIYEADCREWAERQHDEIEIGEVILESDVSGATAMAERGLGPLLDRVAAGESDGILTPNVERFGRDTIEGCLGWKRVHDAGGRLVFVKDGIDSANPDHQTFFEMRLVFASDFLRRTRANFQSRIERRAAEGAYLACQPPVGYVKDHDTGRIHPHPQLEPLIKEAFERRANGETARGIAKWLRAKGSDIEVPNPKHPKKRRKGDMEHVRPLAHITENGVRHMIKSDAYLGLSRVQSRKKGEPRKIENAHKPIVTNDLWERAQAAGGPYRPSTGRLSSQVRLSGLVYCSGCGKRLKVGGSGKHQEPVYLCTREDCTQRSGISAARLDAYVEGLLQDAILAGEPHIVAVLEGDDRYERALAAVEAARLELDTYRTQIKVTDVGVEQWKADVGARQAALDLARAELRQTPAPKKQMYTGKHPAAGIRGQSARAHAKRVRAVEAAMNREANARLLARVVVRPVGRGRRVPPAKRADVYLVGAAEPYVAPEAEAAPVSDVPGP